MSTITLHDLTLTGNREIAPGLFKARDSQNFLRLHDGEKFRGYATTWGKRWQAQAWSNTGRFRRTTFKTQAGAERVLIREALKLI